VPKEKKTDNKGKRKESEEKNNTRGIL